MRDGAHDGDIRCATTRHGCAAHRCDRDGAVRHHECRGFRSRSAIGIADGEAGDGQTHARRRGLRSRHRIDRRIIHRRDIDRRGIATRQRTAAASVTVVANLQRQYCARAGCVGVVVVDHRTCSIGRQQRVDLRQRAGNSDRRCTAIGHDRATSASGNCEDSLADGQHRRHRGGWAGIRITDRHAGVLQAQVGLLRCAVRRWCDRRYRCVVDCIDRDRRRTAVLRTGRNAWCSVADVPGERARKVAAEVGRVVGVRDELRIAKRLSIVRDRVGAAEGQGFIAAAVGGNADGNEGAGNRSAGAVGGAVENGQRIAATNEAAADHDCGAHQTDAIGIRDSGSRTQQLERRGLLCGGGGRADERKLRNGLEKKTGRDEVRIGAVDLGERRSRCEAMAVGAQRQRIDVAGRHRRCRRIAIGAQVKNLRRWIERDGAVVTAVQIYATGQRHRRRRAARYRHVPQSYFWIRAIGEVSGFKINQALCEIDSNTFDGMVIAGVRGRELACET